MKAKKTLGENEVYRGDTHCNNGIDFSTIQPLTTYSDRLTALLALRNTITQKLIDHGKCCLEYIYDRARVYQALDYDDLAAFDAYTVHLLALKHLDPDEFVTDLQAHDAEGGPWQPSEDEAREWLSKAMRVLVPCLDRLGATRDAATMLAMWSKPPFGLTEFDAGLDQFSTTYNGFISQNTTWSLSRSDDTADNFVQASRPDQAMGMARREIYPWSTYEPDRTSQAALDEINASLSTIAPKLEARVTILRDLNDPNKQWKQLGLFAREDLEPGEEVLREKSLITAIRPLEDAICDACGQDLEEVLAEERCQCEGYDCDITFCSRECKDRAAREYHVAQEEEEEGEEEDEDEDTYDDATADGTDAACTHSTSPAPFCSNQDNLNSIGRLQTSTTPEPELYFLLLARVTAMSVTQQVHPLLLPGIKHLWGDFTSTSPARIPAPRTLPFTLSHSIILPLEYFSTLSLTLPAVAPYTSYWIRTFDSWILQTLVSKFRGVANATQSSFDGKPEIAMVHPHWCLANHSCEPNVNWQPAGVRTFTVRDLHPADVQTQDDSIGTEFDDPKKDMATTSKRNRNRSSGQNADRNRVRRIGIKRDQEIFSHYTDISLDVAERRARLRDVLGGECMCARCERESRNTG